MDPRYTLRKRAIALAVAGVATTSLSGCVNELMLGYFGATTLYLYTHPEATEEDWSEVRTAREPRAEMVQYRHDVSFSPGAYTMSSTEGQQLSSFLSRVDVGYGDTVVLMAEPAEGADIDTASRLTERRAETVSDFLAVNRIDAKDLLSRLGNSPSSNDAVTVVVRRHVVALPACPDWTDKPGDNATNQPMSNWSCATATNFGMMVADPGDLARGREPGYADGERQATSIENFRKGETAPLKTDVSTQDTFSRIGIKLVAMLAKVLPKSKSNEPLAFSAFITDDDTRSVVMQAANDMGFGDAPIVQGAVAEAVKQLANASTPKLLLVDLSGSTDPLSDLASLAEVCDEGTQVVTIGDVNDVGLYRSLVGVGVNDYLVKPVSAELLAPALTRIEEKPRDDAQGAVQDASKGKLISVIGTRGGVGATSVAVNFAWTIAHEHKQRVALVDLDVFFGNCGLTLDLESGRGFREALENPSRIDGLFIERAMVRESDNLYVLTAEEPLEQKLAFNNVAVELLLDHLRRDFQCVVLDLPRFAARTQMSVLAPPSSVIFVSEPSLSGMRDTARLSSLFKQGGCKADVAVALNRVGTNKKAELSKADFERGAEIKVSHSIPFDPKVFAESVSTGKPLLKAGPRSKAAAVVREIGAAQCGTQDETNEKLPFWKKLGKRKK